jgi:hypothetical protein
MQAFFVVNQPLRIGNLIMPNQVNRRFFVKLSVMSLAAAPLGHLLMGKPAQAQTTRSGRSDGPKQIPGVDMDDAQAKALYYAENATQSPFRKSDVQFCHNCMLYSGQEGAQWGPCAIFSYRANKYNQALVVNANGWCRSWGPRSA